MKKKEIEEKYKLYFRLVTTVGNFQNYNRFFNIYSEHEDVMRRVLVLTPYKELEEVYDMGEEVKIDHPIIHDGNLWLKEYSFFTGLKSIDLENFEVDKETIEEYLKTL